MNRIAPKQRISQRVSLEYYSLSHTSYPQRSSYKELRHASITTKAIDTTVKTSRNAESLQAGDAVNFTFLLQIPECLTNLNTSFSVPTVPRNVIDLQQKKRRDLTQLLNFRNDVAYR